MKDIIKIIEKIRDDNRKEEGDENDIVSSGDYAMGIEDTCNELLDLLKK